MFGRKAKDLEGQLAQSQQEVAILAKKVETISAELAEFKAKEAAISGALTNAQRTADKVVAEANAKRDSILAEAEAAKSAAQAEAGETAEKAKAEANDLVASARQEAERIVAEAREKARSLELQGEAFMAQYREKAACFDKNLREAALAAAAQAEQFRSFASGIELPGGEECAAPLEMLVQESPALPETYDTPASLMKSIYAIENRDIPQQQQQEAAEAPAEAAAQEGEEPERMWTVDEIMKDAPAGSLSLNETEIDLELDAIISDVLKDS